MEIKDMRAFYAIVEEGNISHAAQRLDIAQPALSRQMKRLETALGVQLFERGSRLVISYVPQDSSFLRGSISAYARSSGVDESLMRAILHKLGFVRAQFDRDLSEFSAGQKKKVLIARSLCEPAHLHVWDEPLNYIDVISRMQIEELLLGSAPTLLFVEHDRVFCDRIASKIIEL